MLKLYLFLGTGVGFAMVRAALGASGPFYPADSKALCHGTFEGETIDVEVKDSLSTVKRAGGGVPEREVSFTEVIGALDANGESLYVAKGFALRVNTVTNKGTYLGAVGIGAWLVQRLAGPIALDRCSVGVIEDAAH